jgi:hypothetical protein
MPIGGGRRGGFGGGRMAARRRTTRMVRMMAVRMAMRQRRRRRRRRLLLVGGLVAFGAYKLSKRDVKRVEEHTGQKAEELTDEQLEQAMDQLGIEKQTVSDEEWEAAEQAEEQTSYLDELERLGELHEAGILTDEEFAAKKKELLGL